MRKLGGVVLFLGALFILVSLNMDTSVPTEMGGRVNNLGLIAEKQNYLLLSAFIFICGLLMILLGNRNSDQGSVKCPYCAERIHPEAIKCKHCGSEVNSELRSNRERTFKPTDMSFDRFFVRKGNEFVLNEPAVDELVIRLQKTDHQSNMIEITEKNKQNLDELIAQLPSKVQQEFRIYYHAKI